jgi:beta-glucanase (GH16 family)
MKLRVVEDRTQSMQDSESASNKVSKTREVRSGKLIFISLACLCLIFAVLGSYLQLWNLPQRLLLTIMPPKESSIITNSRLIFDDEFNGTSLDTSKWNIEDMSINGYHNCCLNYGKQFFSPQDLSVLDGYLRITTNKQTIEGYAYTPGAITTEDKLSFT